MKILYDKNITRKNNILIPISEPITNEIIKINIVGELRANNNDQRILIRINGNDKNYNSFSIMDGNAREAELESSGFYLGRNGWRIDADFSCEYTLSVNSLTKKVTGYGMSTFSAADNKMIGCQNNGVLNEIGDSPISKIEISFSKGAIDGRCVVYSL